MSRETLWSDLKFIWRECRRAGMVILIFGVVVGAWLG